MGTRVKEELLGIVEVDMGLGQWPRGCRYRAITRLWNTRRVGWGEAVSL